MSNRELKCLICGKAFPDAIPRTEPGDEKWARQPIDAMCFTAHGHYGSRFDPIEPGTETVFEVWLCDEHVFKADADRVILKQRGREWVEIENRYRDLPPERTP